MDAHHNRPAMTEHDQAQRADEAISYTIDDVRRFHGAFDLAAWQAEGGELTRYCYLRMSEFFPQALIPREGAISSLARAEIPDVAAVETDTPLGHVTLRRFLQMAPIDGFLVVHNGRIAFEAYPRMRSTDKHQWWSITKTLASTLVALLDERGLVEVDQPIDSYLPELTRSGWNGVTVRDILDMTSGIDCLESDDPGAYTDPAAPFYSYEGTLGLLPRTQRAPGSTYDYVAALPRLEAPGRIYQYASVNTFVLGWLAERLTQTPYADLLQREIWSHLGAESDALMVVSPHGAPASHGGMNSTLRDLARYGLLFTPSWGTVSQRRVISATYLHTIQRGGRPELFDTATSGRDAIRLLGERPRHNTYQWDVVMEDGDFFKAGYHGQGLWVSPARDLVVAYFGHGPAAAAAMKLARAISLSPLFTPR